jgi:NTF2-related export protein 1/2
MADTMSPEENALFSLDVLACSGTLDIPVPPAETNVLLEVAEAFTDAYYYALEKDRESIASFYCPRDPVPDSKLPFIAWNGQRFNDGAEFQDYYEGLSHTHYDIENLDCNILNPKFIAAAAVKGGSGDDSQDLDRRMSIQVVAMGSVRLEEPLKGPIREFSETFILIPNSEKLPTPKPTFDKGWHKEWIIHTQNFRFTEWGASEVPGVKDEEMKTNGEGKNVFQGRNKGIANQFAAAGLLVKGKGKK